MILWIVLKIDETIKTCSFLSFCFKVLCASDLGVFDNELDSLYFHPERLLYLQLYPYHYLHLYVYHVGVWQWSRQSLFHQEILDSIIIFALIIIQIFFMWVFESLFSSGEPSLYSFFISIFMLIMWMLDNKLDSLNFHQEILSSHLSLSFYLYESLFSSGEPSLSISLSLSLSLCCYVYDVGVWQ